MLLCQFQKQNSVTCHFMERDFDPLNFYLGISLAQLTIREAALANVPVGRHLPLVSVKDSCESLLSPICNYLNRNLSSLGMWHSHFWMCLFHKWCLSCLAMCAGTQNTLTHMLPTVELAIWTKDKAPMAQIVPFRSALLSTNVCYFPEPFSVIPLLSVANTSFCVCTVPIPVFPGLCPITCPNFPNSTCLLLSKPIHFFNF